MTMAAICCTIQFPDYGVDLLNYNIILTKNIMLLSFPRDGNGRAAEVGSEVRASDEKAAERMNSIQYFYSTPVVYVDNGCVVEW